MKATTWSVCICVVIGWLTACRAPQDQTLQEAIRAHRDAERLAGQLKTKLARDTRSNPDSIRTWMNELTQWESELMEIPGEAGHDHHRHHHNHQPTVNLTSGQILAIQLEMKKKMEHLQQRIHHGSNP